MPRKACIDAPGALHHIIIRGIERKAIFKDDSDQENFWDLRILSKRCRQKKKCWEVKKYRNSFKVSQFKSLKKCKYVTDIPLFSLVQSSRFYHQPVIGQNTPLFFAKDSLPVVPYLQRNGSTLKKSPCQPFEPPFHIKIWQNGHQLIAALSEKELYSLRATSAQFERSLHSFLLKH